MMKCNVWVVDWWMMRDVDVVPCLPDAQLLWWALGGHLAAMPGHAAFRRLVSITRILCPSQANPTNQRWYITGRKRSAYRSHTRLL